MLKSKNRVLAVSVAVIAVAVLAFSACFALGNGTTMRAYAEDNVDAEGRNINAWTEVNIQSSTYGDNFVTPTVKPAYGASVAYKFYKVDANGKQVGSPYPNMDALKVSGRVPAGRYAMEASVAQTETYTGLESVFYFNVAKATNYWTTSPRIARWAENEAPNYPEAVAAFGEVNFTIRNANGGTLYYDRIGANVRTDRLKEMKAGTYILTTSVDANGEDYTGIPNHAYEFRVFPAIRNEWKVTPSISDYTLAETPNVIAGEALYSDGSQPAVRYRKAGSSNESATAVRPSTLGDVGDWVMVVTVKTEGFVDLVAEVPFKVTLAKNEWTTLPAIKGWTAGETPNAPTGVAKAGQVQFNYFEDGKDLEGAPTEAGDYVMQAVAYEIGYENLSAEVHFTVARNESNSKPNSWVTVPNIQGWREGKKANDPVAEAAHGTVTFTYRNMDGTRVERPSMAGDYYLVATVEAEGYATLVGEVKFTVAERIVVGDNAGFIAVICVLSAIVAMLIVASVILYIRSKGMTVKQAFAKIFKKNR